MKLRAGAIAVLLAVTNVNLSKGSSGQTQLNFSLINQAYACDSGDCITLEGQTPDNGVIVIHDPYGGDAGGNGGGQGGDGTGGTDSPANGNENNPGGGEIVHHHQKQRKKRKKRNVMQEQDKLT